ncbi:hypothetical protein GCM10009558_068480 [Virgisporangium aurantiacum]
MRVAVRAVAGLAIGMLTALVAVACLALAGLVIAPTLAWPAGRATVFRLVSTGVIRLTRLEQWRLGRFLGDAEAAGYRGYGRERALAYLGVRWPVGLLGGAILLLTAYGAGTMVAFTWMWATGGTPDGMRFELWIAAYLFVFAGVLAFLALQGLIGVVRLERRLARRFLGPTDADALRLELPDGWPVVEL